MKQRYACAFWCVVLLVGLLASEGARGQGVRPNNVHCDSRYVQYEISRGVRTMSSTVYRQTLSDTLGREHTVVYYTKEHCEPDNYVWNFFDGMLRVRTERYRDGKLWYRKVFRYGAGGRLAGEEVFEPSAQGDTALVMRVEYSYKGGFCVKKEGRNARGRRVFRVKAKYENGSPYVVSLRTKGRDPYDSLWVERLSRTDIVLDSLKRPVEMVEEKVDREGKKTKFLYRIVYGANGGEQERRAYNPETGALITRETYNTYDTGNPKFEQLYDAQGKLIRVRKHVRTLFSSGHLNQPYLEEF